LKKVFEINSKYLIIIDYKEDLSVDFERIKDIACTYGTIIKENEISVENNFSCNEFIGKTFKGYLIKKK
jgi:hypothetical protein